MLLLYIVVVTTATTAALLNAAHYATITDTTFTVATAAAATTFTLLLLQQECLDWLLQARRGEVWFGGRANYMSTIAHSFSNSFQRAETLCQDSVHVAVGFLDLGSLSTARLGPPAQGSSSNSSGDYSASELAEGMPLRWIALDSSAYCVAKSEVVAAMFRAQAAVDDILQVPQ
jgi:hypothetical protein